MDRHVSMGFGRVIRQRSCWCTSERNEVYPSRSTWRLPREGKLKAIESMAVAAVGGMGGGAARRVLAREREELLAEGMREDWKAAHQSTEKTCAVRPTARILRLTILHRSAESKVGNFDGTTADSASGFPMSSSCRAQHGEELVSDLYRDSSQLTKP
jgi:hypothetical protein